MKKLLLLAFAMILLPMTASAQWEYAGAFPPDGSITSSIHGLATAPNGNVFVQVFSGGNILVYQPDGTPVDTIRTVTVGAVTDTLSQGRGLGTDSAGNLLIANGGSLYQVDPETFEGLNKVIPQDGRPLTAPTSDDQGNIFAGLVVSGDGPLRIYDMDFNFTENAIDTTRGFSRDFEVSADGNAVYFAGYDNFAVHKFTRPDEFSPFNQVPDTLFRGIGAESFARNPSTNRIWVSNGVTATAPPSGRFENTANVWYALDDTDAIVDSLVWNTDAGIADEKPRGLAFSPDGNTAYVAMFDATSGAPSVQMFTRMGDPPLDIERTDDAVPESFTLSQNYPNPFNPETQIQFTLKQAGQARLRVFDMLGREVDVLVNETLTAGTYTATFEAQGLASGTYLYMLEFGDQRLSGTMTLLK